MAGNIEKSIKKAILALKNMTPEYLQQSGFRICGFSQLIIIIIQEKNI